jgi:hypothetical protein
MSTAESAPSGADRLGQERLNLLSKAETLLVPERIIYSVTWEDIVDYERSPQLSDKLKKIHAQNPWLAEAIFPLAGECYWRVSHGHATAELFVKALPVLEEAGITYTKKEVVENVVGFIGHDIGMAYVGLPEEVRNPTLNIGPLSPENREKTNLHPWRGIDRLTQFPSTPYQRKLVGGHHFYGDSYGIDPHGPDAEEEETLTDKKLVVVSAIDVAEARTNIHRRYHTYDRTVDQTRDALKIKFNDNNYLDPRVVRPELKLHMTVIDFLARAAHKQNDFELKAPRKLERFNDWLRAERLDLLDHPDKLVKEFVGFAQVV